MKLNPNWLGWPQTKILINAYGADADKLRFVGGAVRDAVLGITASDVDAATVFTPDENLKLLEKAGIRAIPTGIKHGTITAHIDGKNFEITTLRRDTSCDGRHADVEFTNDWREDAQRRDFTMNALYMATNGEMFDYFDGVKDAKAGKIRFIGDAHTRIQEDYLRILRFFRFYAYYGKITPDAKSLAACSELRANMDTLSGERIQHEMLKIIAAPVPYPALKYMEASGVLQQVCGFDVTLTSSLQRLSFNPQVCFALLLLYADIYPLEALDILAERWRLSGEQKKQVFVLLNNVGHITNAMPLKQQKYFIRKLGNQVFAALVSLKQVLELEEDYTPLLKLAEQWQAPIMPITGKDLLELGMEQGKELGEKLHRLEIIWEDSDYKLSKEELLAKL